MWIVFVYDAEGREVLGRIDEDPSPCDRRSVVLDEDRLKQEELTRFHYWWENIAPSVGFATMSRSFVVNVDAA